MSRASALSPLPTGSPASTGFPWVDPERDEGIPGFLRSADPRLGLLSTAAYTVVLLFPHTS